MSAGGGAGDPARAVARAVLYEGYVLWPYRRSAPKNQRRWTFGGVHPRAWSESGHPDDAWRMRAECLLEVPADGSGGEDPSVRVRARFLQVVERRVACRSDGRLEFRDEVEAGGERWVAWDEAREREVSLPPLPVRPGAEWRTPIALYAASEREWLGDERGERVGAVVRTWRTLTGELSARCERVDDRTFRVRAEVSNETEWDGDDRQDALRSTFASTHVVLEAERAAFVSLTDPPDRLADAAGACRNEGCWPILVGPRGSRDAVLASPIILPDHPAIAPESPGDLFDGSEIDEMLTLHVMALTDEEKAEARATDPRTREILDRTAALGPGRVLGLHGTFRDARTGDPTPGAGPDEGLAEEAPDPFWVEMGRPPAAEIVVDGVALRRGSRVRLHPAPGGDPMDLALAGRTAVVEGIDEDDAGGVHFAVAVEGDPGMDLGMARMPGHRFYFRPEEVEPLGDEAPAFRADVASGPDLARGRDAATGRDPRGREARGGGPPRVLVAGVGNIFLGDDGFGVEVARRLATRALPEGVTVKDFGIRGLDLAYAMRDYDAVVFVDAVPRGSPPGTVYVIEASPEEEGPVAVQTHGVDPVAVLAFARALGPLPDRVYVVGCEPEVVPDPDGNELVGRLSEPVRAAIDEAVSQVESLLAGLAGGGAEARSRAAERENTWDR